jgi:hypothetical protein
VDNKPNVILLEARGVYGRIKAYPANDIARTCAELVGQTTLTEWNRTKLLELGFTIEWTAFNRSRIAEVE